jgi:hypothetical protein
MAERSTDPHHAPSSEGLIVILLLLAGLQFWASQHRFSVAHLLHWLVSRAGYPVFAALAVVSACLIVALLLAVWHLWRFGRPLPLRRYLRRRRWRRAHLVVGNSLRGPYRVADGERGHLLVAGLSGMGKSAFLAACAAQDLVQGRACAVIDPHGSLVADVARLAAHPLTDRSALFLELGQTKTVYALDPLWCRPGEDLDLRVEAAVGAWRAVYRGSWSERIEGHQRGGLRAVAESGWTIAEAQHLYTNPAFRAYLRTRCTSIASREYLDELNTKPARQLSDEAAGVLVRLREVAGNAALRLLFCPQVRDERYAAARPAALPDWQDRLPLDLGALLASGIPVLISLPRTELGEQNRLAAGLLLSLITGTVLRKPTGGRVAHLTLFADELPSYLTDDVVTVLREGRKFGLRLVAATSTLDGLEDKVRGALLGASALAAFQVTADDASLLAREMFAQSCDTLNVLADRLNKMPPRRFHYYARQGQRDGVLLHTLRVRPTALPTVVDDVRTASDRRYGCPRALAEAEMAFRDRWLREQFLPPQAQDTAGSASRIRAGTGKTPARQASARERRPNPFALEEG